MAKESLPSAINMDFFNIRKGKRDYMKQKMDDFFGITKSGSKIK